MQKSDRRSIVKNPIVSQEAYRTFVSLIFSAGMAAWGATLIGLNLFHIKNPQPNFQLAIGNEPCHIILGGILYGCVLVCIFWIYIERLTTLLVPEQLWILVFDFIALSFMAGAAATWNIEKPFITLAFTTIIFLSVRFISACYLEAKKKNLRIISLLFSYNLLANIVAVYFLLLIALALLLLGPYIFGKGIDLDTLPRKLYWVVDGGMGLGIIITVLHSFRHTPIQVRPPDNVIGEETSIPSLCPAYGEIKNDAIVNVSGHVFKGEREFWHLLKLSQNQQSLSLPYHLSCVHTYRDVETQAFIMAHHAQSDREIEIRSMWVYLAHWFDDMFDDYYAEAIANMQLDSNFDISVVLDQLDSKLKTIWEHAVNYTKQTQCWRHEQLLELGMRRLILGGPIFSNRCRNRHSEFIEKHRKLIVANLNGKYGVGNLIEDVRNSNVTDLYLAYTTKVVVEIWDSFSHNADFDLSMIMNLFYAPGLYYHDFVPECEQDQISTSSEEKMDVVTRIIDAVIECIKRLPNEKLKLAIRPVPMFIKSFEPILQKVKLLSKYENFLRTEEIRTALNL